MIALLLLLFFLLFLQLMLFFSFFVQALSVFIFIIVFICAIIFVIFTATFFSFASFVTRGQLILLVSCFDFIFTLFALCLFEDGVGRVHQSIRRLTRKRTSSLNLLVIFSSFYQLESVKLN